MEGKNIEGKGRRGKEGEKREEKKERGREERKGRGREERKERGREEIDSYKWLTKAPIFLALRTALSRR